MRKIITGFFIIMLTTMAAQAVYGKAVGKFTKVEGRVDITRVGSPAEEVNKGTEVFEKDIVRSKSNSKAEILFTDGNILRLAQNTRVEVSEYINASGRRSTILSLFRGKIQNRVKKLLGSVFGNDGNRYEVHTPTAVCGVRGTDFFMYYQKGESGATFKEGFGYGYNKNDPDNMIKVEAGESMIIPEADAPPVVQTASEDEIGRLEGETTPAEEDAEDEDKNKDEDNNLKKDASGSNSDTSGSDDAEDTEGENEGETKSGSGSAEEQQASDTGSAAGDEPGVAGSTAGTGGDIGGAGMFAPEETLMADLESGGVLPEISTPQSDSITPEVVPQIIPVEPVEQIYIPPVEDPQEFISKEDPVPEDPPPVVPPSPTTLMAFTGKMFGLVSGTHYEGEYVLPRTTDPHRTPNYFREEQARYEYQYFLKDDGKTYIRGMSENEIMDSDTWTFYNYAPDGKLLTETGSKGEFLSDTVESTWSGSLAFLANPPSTGYYQRFQTNYTTTIITGTGSFTGDITGIWAELWAATETVPMNITLSGQFASTSSDPLYLFRAPISGTFKDGGAYSGYFGGDATNPSGLIYALYLSPDGTGLGIISGKFSGSVDATGAWNATGKIFPVQAVSGRAYSSSEFLASTGHGFLEVEGLTGTFSGSSGAGLKAFGFGDTSFVRGNDWGIFNLAFGYAGYDESKVSSSWSGRISGNGLFGEYLDSSQQWRKDNGMWAASITKGEWLAGDVSGDITNGKFLTMTKTGTLEGELIGPGGASGNWSAISQGTWKKSNDLSFSSSLEGGLFMVKGEVGGNYSMISNSSIYDYHYDLYTHEGGYHFYNAGAGTDTYYQVNARSFDGTYANFYSQTRIYNNSTKNFISYNATGPFTMFDLASLATPPGTYSWDNNNTWHSFNMFNTGMLDGIMGGLENLWGANSGNLANITFLGYYDAPFYVTSSQPLIFANAIESYNPYNDTDTTPDGGAYAGFIGGVLGPSTRGNIYAVYIDPSNRAGVLLGKYQGNADRVSGIWEADGGMYPVQIKTDSSPAGTLISGMIKKDFSFWGRANYGTYYYPGKGNFLDAMGFSSGYINAGGGHHSSLNIGGEPWGVWQAVLGGVYSGTPSNRWTIDYRNDVYIEGVGDSTEMIAKYKVDGTWSGNSIEGKMLGAWVDLKDIPAVGVSAGKISGTYDPTVSENMTWQSAGTGVWVKAGKFLEMAATDSGRSTLSSLNIPAVEIGRTTLSGTGSTVSVTMHDVTFFASSTGAAPELWAAGNITGTFTANPLGQSIYLSNGDLYADINIKEWDATSRTWGADISNGNGTLMRSDTSIPEQITFSGVAGGTHTGGSSGSFSGEGAGYVNVKP